MSQAKNPIYSTPDLIREAAALKAELAIQEAMRDSRRKINDYSTELTRFYQQSYEPAKRELLIWTGEADGDNVGKLLDEGYVQQNYLITSEERQDMLSLQEDIEYRKYGAAVGFGGTVLAKIYKGIELQAVAQMEKLIKTSVR